MKYIELFAGCGGLSLGLESKGFELLFANELSPMASETFSYNFFNENLESLASKGRTAEHTLWLNSKFKRNELTKRLRENPKEAPQLGEGHNDLLDKDSKIQNSMVVGSITDLNNFLSSNKKILNQVKKGFGKGQIDLISGGPPCQSFSMAGLRQHDNARNQLPWEFAKFVDLLKPKIVMLENVSGILRAFNIDGEKHFAWFEVSKAFASIGYVPICIHTNAKYAGAAQNRPRFIMIAIQEKQFKAFMGNIDGETNKIILNDSYAFFKAIKKGIDIPYESLKCYDIENGEELFNDSFFKPLYKYNKGKWRSVEKAIDDLRKNGVKKSSYVKELNNSLNITNKVKTRKISNNELRSNGIHVQKRFRLYQILSKATKSTQKNVAKFLRYPHDCPLEESTIEELRNEKFLVSKEHFTDLSPASLKEYLLSLGTKKQTQRALKKDEPAPAALSIPDDACHYHTDELRTLTVREMARIQSFPDWFEFRSKVTTGGKMRRFEVPQYTQVGNAVPPLFGVALGEMIIGILNTIDKK